MELQIAPTTTRQVSSTEWPTELIETLEQIQQRVLWLATLMIHHANHVRPNPDGVKVGGHQASSASIVTVLTALYFHFLQSGDRVAVKPHASPIFHAIQYLLGQLPQSYLTTLRAYGGLQSYPSRTKDPEAIDFSTGSVGLGAVAPAFAALAHRYAVAHFGSVTSRHFVALIGDAELDEGNVWEAILDEALDGLENLIWIVDLNRQSLDRVVPGIRASRLKRLFSSNGWQVLEAKYGRRLQALFRQPGGSALRERIDAMANEEYQALIRTSGSELRPRLINGDPQIEQVLATVPDAQLPDILANLGGHDFAELLTVLQQADAQPRKPTIIFAYTVKGWGLPIAGQPLNHAALLTPEQIVAFRERSGLDEASQWDAFNPHTPAGRLCATAAQRLYPPRTTPIPHIPLTSIPNELGVPAEAATSTQDTFGRCLVRLADLPELRERIVTTSPDVSISTNLAGWINKRGVFAPRDEPDYETEAYRLLKWKRGPSGQHIELGISEMNLFMLLGMLGLADELCGQPLIPIGTVYDPFVLRGLDALIYGVYSGARFIFAGTPSGITLAPEGGAHQSTVTPSVGIELPGLDYFEPCFVRETEWALLEALRLCCDREHGRATYLRLSTRPIEQTLLNPALQRLGVAELRRQVLLGGYRLRDRRDTPLPTTDAPIVSLVTNGALIPEVVAAAELLHNEGVQVNILNLTSPRRLYEAWQQRQTRFMEHLLLTDERHAPIVTVHDAASHALAWFGSIYGAPTTSLGVDAFGQSGSRNDLYRHFGLDPWSIAEAAFRACE